MSVDVDVAPMLVELLLSPLQPQWIEIWIDEIAQSNCGLRPAVELWHPGLWHEFLRLGGRRRIGRTI